MVRGCTCHWPATLPWLAAYMCHHNSFLLFGALKDPSQRRWNRVTHVSLALSCVIIILFGVGGYVTFTDFSQGMHLLCSTATWLGCQGIWHLLTIRYRLGGHLNSWKYPKHCFIGNFIFLNKILRKQVPTHKLICFWCVPDARIPRNYLCSNSFPQLSVLVLPAATCDCSSQEGFCAVISDFFLCFPNLSFILKWEI